MAGLPVIYPDTLPHPEVGQFTPRERRAINREFMRPISRDRAGTRSVAFTFTPVQAREFREWYQEWVTMGGGMFAAPWPMPWGRGPHVFRFVEPPTWQLIGGGIDGQGYWRVTADVELRGRGELPELEVFTVTSKPYPVDLSDEIAGEFGILGGRYDPQFQDEINGSFVFGGVEMKAVMVYAEYAEFGPDELDGHFGLGGVELKRIVVAQDGQTDELDGRFEIGDIELKQVLIQYTNWTPDEIDGQFGFIGITLE